MGGGGAAAELMPPSKASRPVQTSQMMAAGRRWGKTVQVATDVTTVWEIGLLCVKGALPGVKKAILGSGATKGVGTPAGGQQGGSAHHRPSLPARPRESCLRVVPLSPWPLM